MKTKRRTLDQYFTPVNAIEGMLERLTFELSGTIFEPCCGDWAIVNALAERLDLTRTTIVTNDIDPHLKAMTHLDMRKIESWNEINDVWGVKSDSKKIDWTITNPPYTKAIEIVKHAHNHSKFGVVALLRLSFLEPCNDRADWLEYHPPSQVIVTPRISFTGDGKTDSTTTAWFVWNKRQNNNCISFIRR